MKITDVYFYQEKRLKDPTIYNLVDKNPFRYSQIKDFMESLVYAKKS